MALRLAKGGSRGRAVRSEREVEKWGQRAGERKREAGPTEMVTCLAWVGGLKRARQVDIITTTSLLQ